MFEAKGWWWYAQDVLEYLFGFVAEAKKKFDDFGDVDPPFLPGDVDLVE